MMRVLSAIFVRNVQKVANQAGIAQGLRGGETSAQSGVLSPTVPVPEMGIMPRTVPEKDTGGERQFSKPRIKQGGFELSGWE